MSSLISYSVFLFFPVIIVCGIGLCVLEFFLARKDQKIYGLILPIVSFGISLIIILYTLINAMGDLLSVVAGVLLVGLLTNIPTAIFLIIFFIARATKKGRVKKNSEIEKMNIMDLE